ncbi:MAG: hypothetical protein KAU03_03595 [Candidatus Altiarchaeales archaeon]|nr:hypothetical protein [Candidatus Altiarchaeales archaeon]
MISLIYDHVLIDLQHKYHRVIHNCMELIIVRRNARKINEIRDRLTSVRGVKHSDHEILDFFS